MTVVYDENYYEKGIETGKSCYQNYRWIPELTIPMAMTMIDYLNIKPDHTILDFGCAKGYLVKAFRWLNRQAWGIDVSQYAIDNCDFEVAEYCKNSRMDCVISRSLAPFSFCIAKDVFEHIELKYLEQFFLNKLAIKYFVVVPLGESCGYRAPANNMDITHVNCMDENEWETFFRGVGMKVEYFDFRVPGIKDSYYDKYPCAHGFYTLYHDSIP